MDINIYIENEISGLDEADVRGCLERSLTELRRGRSLKKALIIPPDITRANSGAGLLTAMYYELLTSGGNATVDILPALGTHAPMTRDEQTAFFGDKIPAGRFLVHDWRTGVESIGQIPGSYVHDVSGGLIGSPIDVEISRYLLDPSYDLILSVGQVVPHEVAGMANYTKNIVVGCGGSSFINGSHMLGAVVGLESIMGRDHSPVRRVFDYAQEHFLSGLNIVYVLTVTAAENEDVKILGLYISGNRDGFNRAVALSQKHNLSRVGRPVKTCVVRLDETEYRSTWLGNKAVYRTRMAMEDGGNLIILAPGICRFGEDDTIDALIRKYGYRGRDTILRLCKTEPDLRSNLSAAAHLIHGSSDGRFTVTYATRLLSKEEVEGVGFSYLPYERAIELYYPQQPADGFTTAPCGREIFYIGNPALGLWTK